MNQFYGGGMSEEEQIALALQMSREDNMQIDSTFNTGNNNSIVSKNKRVELPFNTSNYAEKLRAGFGNLFRDPVGSDVVLKVGSSTIHCHSLVLAVWSDNFRILLKDAEPEEVYEEAESLAQSISAEEEASLLKRKRSNFAQQESQQQDPQQAQESSTEPAPEPKKKATLKKVLKLEVKETEIPIFKLMIEYLYRGTVAVDEDQMVPLLALSNEYNIGPLKDSCIQVLGKNINDSNLFSLLDVVERYSCEQLRIMIAEYLAKNFQKLSATGVLLQLDVATWKGLIQSDELMVDSEEQVYHAVTTYAEQFPPEQKKEVLQGLLPHVRFALMESKSLVDIEENPIINDVPALRSLLFEAYKYKSNPKAPTTLRTQRRRGMISLGEQYGYDKGRKHHMGGYY